MFKPAKVLLLSLVALALSFGCALAAVDRDAPYVVWSPTSFAQILNGKTDYHPTASSGYHPEFHWAYLEIFSDNPKAPLPQSGTVTLDTKNPAPVVYFNLARDATAMDRLSGRKNLPLRKLSDTHLSVIDAHGGEAQFYHSGSETAFSGQPYAVRGDGLNLSDKFPVFHTTESQMTAKCVPYIELIAGETGEMLTHVRWRFVNAAAPEAAVKMNDSNYNISRLGKLQIGQRNDSGILNQTDVPIDKDFEFGESLEGLATLKTPISIDRIQYVQPCYRYQDGETKHAYVEYAWRFHLSGTVAPNNQPVLPKPEPEEVAAAAKAASDDLKLDPSKVTAVELTRVMTGTSVTYADDADDEIKSRTSSVIAIRQPVVNTGDAVLLAAANQLVMPLNSKSITGLELPKPSDFDALVKNYRVCKIFESGVYIDLLEEYGSDLFSYDADTGVTLKAALVVINDAAPKKAVRDEIIRPHENANFGVRFNYDNNVLYVWDGEADSAVSDPIALVRAENNDEDRRRRDVLRVWEDIANGVVSDSIVFAQDKGGEGGEGENNTNSTGIQGCDAGFGLFALFTLGAVALVPRKK